MSRVGRKPIQVPDKVKIKVESPKVFAEGPKGKLEWAMPNGAELKIEDNSITVNIAKGTERASSLQGLVRSCVSNMIKGVNEGYVRNLEINGVGYRAQAQAKSLNLQLGFSHPVEFRIPEGITIKTPKPNRISIEGIDKAKVGEVAAEIRAYLKPEPYKGKGIRYEGEYVRKKAGKAVA